MEPQNLFKLQQELVSSSTCQITIVLLVASFLFSLDLFFPSQNCVDLLSI